MNNVFYKVKQGLNPLPTLTILMVFLSNQTPRLTAALAASQWKRRSHLWPISDEQEIKESCHLIIILEPELVFYLPDVLFAVESDWCLFTCRHERCVADGKTPRLYIPDRKLGSLVFITRFFKLEDFVSKNE